ncbi:lipid-A-disaccharide synthase [Afipia clevelandensis]|uniref:Lipid-A-disaccharide synthase n=1 Tax=Afipia clevelandensis ATCC 49720 TaxID=883079 RepID=K8PLD4_9BRAD|nr:lipid-A-disaccharide synthase [Afipia clevelandensis]EKS40310.1 lipid-A-disaccharide synthase [Afipia clevelandensis ATCC 49720]
MSGGKTLQGPKVFVIAAEESGDRLGAGLIKALRERLGPAATFSGIGGSHMAEQGLVSLFPTEQLAIIGLVAIPKRLPMILRRIREATDAVIAAKPDVLVIIDSPDFTHRVARRVRAANPSIPIVNYVSPTVWVWRPGRARKMRAYVDRLLAVLPFEPEVHRKLGGPPCSYVGHPLLDDLGALRPDADEQARRAAQPPVLLVLPGSRRSEIRRNMAIFGETLRLLREQGVVFEPVLPTIPHLVEAVRASAATWPVRPTIVASESDKRAAFRVARAALAKSGTVTLELALAGVPMVTAYRVTELEAFIARRVIQTSSIILPNLILGENVIPEFLQQDFTAENLAPALRDVLADTPARQRQFEAFAKIEQIMSTGGRKPSVLAAEGVMAAIR